MDQEMLAATQQAAWAAQSAAQAAWWALAVNGAVVVVAIGTTFFQEWRVRIRTNATRDALHQGAKDSVQQGIQAIRAAVEQFYPAANVDPDRVVDRIKAANRARRVIELFVGREVDPKVLDMLLHMNALLKDTETALDQVVQQAWRKRVENAEVNGSMNHILDAAEEVARKPL